MSQKAENLLNLALDATSEEREKSLELEVGYQPLDQEWDLIIKYSGNLEAVREIASSVTELSNEYAILTVPESRIEQLTRVPQIEYIEKPKRLFFEAANGKRASCILPVQAAPLKLYGKGILTAVIDSGIDYSHPDFRNTDGSTRIRALWEILLKDIFWERNIRRIRSMRHFRNRQKSGRSRLYQVGMCRGTGLLLPQLQPETEEEVSVVFMRESHRRVNS